MSTATLKQTSVSDILAQAQQVEIDKKFAIEGLLKERKDLQQNTSIRLTEIKGELALLGYKVARPRKAK